MVVGGLRGLWLLYGVCKVHICGKEAVRFMLVVKEL